MCKQNSMNNYTVAHIARSIHKPSMHKGQVVYIYILFYIHQAAESTQHEVVEYSEECNQEPLSSWAGAINVHNIEEEIYDIYSLESITELETIAM